MISNRPAVWVAIVVLALSAACSSVYAFVDNAKKAESKTETKTSKKSAEEPKPAISLAGPVDRKAIESAIGKAKRYLYSIQKDGNWEASDKNPYKANQNDAHAGGITALVVYALLAAGENPQDPKLIPAITYLKTVNMNGTYALAVRCLVWLHLPPSPEIKRLMQRDADRLVSLTRASGEARGMHDYGPSISSTGYSHSRSQYAVLGLWAATQAGIEVPSRYWSAVEEAFIDHQRKGGGWSYQKTGTKGIAGLETETVGMTTVGVASLFITQDQLRPDAGSTCGGHKPSAPIEAGLKWLAEHVDDHFNAMAARRRYGRDFPYPTLYSIERVGVAAGYKRLGKIDWFAEGSKLLVRLQHNDGHWEATGNKIIDGMTAPVPDTCFSLLFLARGRSPVLMNKLPYTASTSDGKPDATVWTQRARDVANLATWIGRQTESFFKWQIVNLAGGAADLDDAPVLYLSGSQPFEFSDSETALLRKYIEEGGIILGNADCGRDAFASSFRKLGQKMFPLYEFRTLPETHSIFVDQQFKAAKWKKKPTLQGLSNGCRELMILIPQSDPAKSWQLGSGGDRDESYQLAADIYQYATDMQSLAGGFEGHLVRRSNSADPSHTIRLARLKHQANWDPEPGGWRRIQNLLHNNQQAKLEVQTVELAKGSLDGFQVAHLTGTVALNLTDAARTQLKKFVGGGGVLVIDSAGGSVEFASSVDKELAAIFGDNAKQIEEPLPAEHELYKNAGKAFPAVYRRAARAAVGQMNGGRLRGITVNDRLGVIYSREDLSVGLVGQQVSGIVGYDPQTATALMTNILLSAGK